WPRGAFFPTTCTASAREERIVTMGALDWIAEKAKAVEETVVEEVAPVVEVAEKTAEVVTNPVEATVDAIKKVDVAELGKTFNHYADEATKIETAPVERLSGAVKKGVNFVEDETHAAGDAVENATKGIPVVEQLTKVAVGAGETYVDFEGGVVRGAADMAEGL